MNTSNFTILNCFKIIQRWPYLFLMPFLISLITLLVFSSSVDKFRASAIVLFETGYIPVEEYFTLLDKFDDRPVTIVRSLLYGEPVRSIVEEVWPEVKDQELLLNEKIEQLRSLSGIILKFQRDNPQALSISYDATSPELAYKVIQATLKSLLRFNQDLTNKKISAAVEFLQKELEKSSRNLSDLEQKIIRVRAGLPQSYLKGQDQNLQDIQKSLDMPAVNSDLGESITAALNSQKSPEELEYELEISTKELQQLEADLQSKDYLNSLNNLELILNASSDPETARTSSLIIEKQQRLNELQSKGFLEAHPDVASIKRELENLIKMKQSRLLELQKLSVQESPELTNLRMEKLQLKKIEDKKMEIRAIEDRLTTARADSEKNKGKAFTLDDRLKEVSDRRSELLELESTKIAAAHSYAQMAKRLEVLQREGRVDQQKFGLSVSIAEAPKLPTNPQPFASLPIILAGLVISACSLFGLAAIMSYFDKAIYSRQQLFQVSKLPVIGVIDTFSTQADIKFSKLKLKVSVLLLLLYALILFIYFKS